MFNFTSNGDYNIINTVLWVLQEKEDIWIYSSSITPISFDV